MLNLRFFLRLFVNRAQAYFSREVQHSDSGGRRLEFSLKSLPWSVLDWESIFCTNIKQAIFLTFPSVRIGLRHFFKLQDVAGRANGQY